MQHFIKRHNSKVASTTQPDLISPMRTMDNKFATSSQQIKNIKRAQQITCLHQQFEDLKKKIKQVQNKNQKIIQKIHKQSNFKKKNPQSYEISGQSLNPIVYYQKKQKSQYSHLSEGEPHQSNKSDQSEFEYPHLKSKRNSTKKNIPSNKQLSPHLFIQSQTLQNQRSQQKSFQKVSLQNPNKKSSRVLYDNNQNYSQEIIGYGKYSQYQNPIISNHNIKSGTVQHFPDYVQMSAQLQPYPSHPHMGGSQFSQTYTHPASYPVYQLEQALKKEKQKSEYYEGELKKKTSQISTLSKPKVNLTNYNYNVQIIVEENLQNFLQNVIKRGMLEIQKNIKKSQNKLKRLFLHVKDSYEQHKSSRLIRQHRKKRSNSRSRKSHSPIHNTSVQSIKENKGSRNTSSNQINSRSRVKQQQQIKKNKDFEQIVAKYEDIITSKNEQINKLQQTLKQKSKTCNQINIQLDQKNKQLKEIKVKIQQLQSLINRSEQYNLQQVVIKQKRHSTQTNLLQNIQENQTQWSQLQLKLIQMSKQLESKNKIISNLQNQCKFLKNKNQNQSINSKQVNSPKVLNNSNEQTFMKLQSIIKQLQKKCVDKDCEIYNLQNKNRKQQGLHNVYENKIKQLQKLLSTENNDHLGDILDHSVCIDQNTTSIRVQIQALQSRLSQKQDEILSLVRKNQQKQTKIKQLEKGNNQLKKQKERMTEQIRNLNFQIQTLRSQLSNVQSGQSQSGNEAENKQQALNMFDDLQDSFLNTEQQETKLKLEEDLLFYKQKYEESQKIYTNLKNQHLEVTRKNINLTSQNQYLNESLSERQQKYQKCKRQVQQLKAKFHELSLMYRKKEDELDIQKRQNCDKIKEIQKQWLEFQNQIKAKEDNLDNSQMKNSRHISDASFLLVSHSKNAAYLQEQNQYLANKLHQAQATIQTHNLMEQKVLNQYKDNVQKLKHQIRQKNKLLANNAMQIQTLRQKIRKLELNQSNHSKRQKQLINSNISKKSQKLSIQQLEDQDRILEKFGSESQLMDQENNPFQRIYQLQAQLKEAKDINSKLAQMEQQLFEQIKLKQEEILQKNKIIDSKNGKIQQLQDIIQIKDMNIGSHISSSNMKSSKVNKDNFQRQSMKSHSSLRYSALSHHANERFQIQLSQAGSQFFDQSYITNISQIFQKQQFPYEKVQLRRKQQIRLFQKTSSYIKSLKDSINQKNKRIKLLQKKIQNLKKNEYIGNDNNHQIGTVATSNQATYGLDATFEDVFKDYQSVQLEKKRLTHHSKYKNLQHQFKLVVEENNMLLNQIQSLQQELQKAEQQQNSLVKIKDLYKQQIKKLLRKNQDQAKAFEQELAKQKKKIQISESAHNLQSLKKLLVRIVQVSINLEQQKVKKKREQRKKELEQAVNIFISMSGLQISIKDRLNKGLQRVRNVHHGQS